MLLSFALILLCGLILSNIMEKFKLPGLLGMMAAGAVLGPYALNLISPTILDNSADIKIIALIIILIRAGFALDLKDLKKIGRPAILMSCIPAIFEMITVIVFAPMLLPVSHLEAAVLGAVLAATSPAIIIPRMLKIKEKGYGTEKSIPQLMMAGASANGIFVIVLFTSFLGMYQGEGFNVAGILQLPIAVVAGLALGAVLGVCLAIFFKKSHVSDMVKMLIFLSIAFLFAALDDTINQYIPFSGLLAVMALSVTILSLSKATAKLLSGKFSKIWVCAEVLLFVLIGAAIDISYMHDIGFAACLLIALALMFRMAGVWCCLIRTNLWAREKLFCMVAYMPKATIQAAIGSIPLSAGVAAGHTILAIAVLTIIITAPLGAIGIDRLYKKLLTKKE